MEYIQSLQKIISSGSFLSTELLEPVQRIPATPSCLDFEASSLTSCGCGHTDLVYSVSQDPRKSTLVGAVESNWVVGKTEISTSRSRHFRMNLIFCRFRNGSGSFVGADTRKPCFGLYLRVHRGSASVNRHPRRNCPAALAQHIKLYPREMLEAASESLTSQCPLALEFLSKPLKHRTLSRSHMDSVAGNWHVRHLEEAN